MAGGGSSLLVMVLMYVNEKGIINESGVSVKGNSVGIRSAIWIDISQH